MTYRPYILLFLLLALLFGGGCGTVRDVLDHLPPIDTPPGPMPPPPQPSPIDTGDVYPEPEPEPEPPPIVQPDRTIVWRNDTTAGYTIRLKDYRTSADPRVTPDGRYAGRGTVLKIDARFGTVCGFTPANSHIEIGEYRFDFYAYDDGANRDLCYGSAALPKDMPAPLEIRLYRDGELHTVCPVDRWAYKAVTVPASVEVTP